MQDIEIDIDYFVQFALTYRSNSNVKQNKTILFVVVNSYSQRLLLFDDCLRMLLLYFQTTKVCCIVLFFIRLFVFFIDFSFARILDDNDRV